MTTQHILAALVVACAPFGIAQAAQQFESGDPKIQSISSLTFGPKGVLFLGDSRTGAAFALELEAGTAPDEVKPFVLGDVETRIAGRLGTTKDEVMIHDMAVHPTDQKVYLAVSRGRAKWTGIFELPNDVADADVLLTLDREGAIEAVDLKSVRFARVDLPNPVEQGKAHRWKRGVELRADTITDLAFANDTLFVTGLSNEEFASTLWRIPIGAFDGSGDIAATTLEIYHGAHGAYETHAPIRTFVPYEIAGESQILAAYLCTPLVTFPTEALEGGAHVKGRTVAELGSGNAPLDMVAYQKKGEERLLIANSNLPLMVIDAKDIAAYEGEITAEPEGYVAGVPYEPRSGNGIQQLAKLNDELFVALQRMPNGTLSVITYPVSRF